MVRFKRMAEAFNEVTRININKPGDESSGSEHSADLSDLVNSFIEQEIREQRDNGGIKGDIDHHHDDDDGDDENIIDDENDDSPDFDLQDSLRSLLYNRDDDVRRNLYSEVEKALREVKCDSSMDFKRTLMAQLRARGFDAGLCKSKWQKSGRTPAGNYEYIDVVTTSSKDRHIIEVSLAEEFEIARPTTRYSSMLEIFPPIYVGTPCELKKVTRIMSNAIRKSMKSGKLSMPPWRRLAYMHNKWFGSYKRTVNEVSGRDHLMTSFGRGIDGDNRSVVGFEKINQGLSKLKYCRDGDLGVAKGRVRIGNLALELQS